MNSFHQKLRKAKDQTFITLTAISAVLGSMGMLLAFSGIASAASSSYNLFGDAVIVQPGFNSLHTAQTESSATVNPGYGGIDFGVPSGVTTLSSLNTLSSEYEFTQGSCSGGAPRFVVSLNTNSGPENLFFYLGPAPNYTGCPLNSWQNSGNLADPANLVDATQLGGTFYEPFSSVQASFGDDTVTDVAIVTDAYWASGNQTVRFDNTEINSNEYTYEPTPTKDTCKKDGWKQFSNPAFKNQGQCVSWVEHNVDGRGR